MTDTTDVEQNDVEQNDVDRLIAAGLDAVDLSSRIGVSLAVDPDDYASGGVPGGLASMADMYVVYDGGGKNSTAVAIVPIDQIGRPGSAARQLAGAKITEVAPGACSWNVKRNETTVALKVSKIEPKAERTAKRNRSRYETLQAKAIDRGDPQPVLDGWASVLAQ